MSGLREALILIKMEQLGISREEATKIVSKEDKAAKDKAVAEMLKLNDESTKKSMS